MRDEALEAGIRRIHKDNYWVLGARNMHAMLNRPDAVHELGRVARCTIERLIRTMGLHGIRRTKSSRAARRGGPYVVCRAAVGGFGLLAVVEGVVVDRGVQGQDAVVGLGEDGLAQSVLSWLRLCW